jgi:hypothetical protein
VKWINEHGGIKAAGKTHKRRAHHLRNGYNRPTAARRRRPCAEPRPRALHQPRHRHRAGEGAAEPVRARAAR